MTLTKPSFPLISRQVAYKSSKKKQSWTHHVHGAFPYLLLSSGILLAFLIWRILQSCTRALFRVWVSCPDRKLSPIWWNSMATHQLPECQADTPFYGNRNSSGSHFKYASKKMTIQECWREQEWEIIPRKFYSIHFYAHCDSCVDVKV